jgi:hypothetical protein
VYQPGTVPRHQPRVIVNNVLDAVKHGMKRSQKEALRELDQMNNGVEVEK